MALCSLAAAGSAQLLLNNQLYYTLHVQGLSSPTSFEFLNSSVMIVLEKNSGKAKVITNGVYTGDALDLPVANEGEMGLLGIVKDPNFASNNFVYLFYSLSDIDGGAWRDDRLVRYTWTGSTLSSPVPLWIMGPTAQYPVGEIYHHGGYIRIGPDNKLYLQRGDMLRWGSFEMNNNINVVAISGCIYRLNLDGSAPSDNPFFSNGNENIKKIWLYGFRNGFGMSWDRSTDNLWFTENGPTVYDEVNIARPGMNSGWRLIMGPDDRNATYPNNGNTAYNANQLLYLPGAQYYDPVFSYLSPIGVAGFEFFSSTRFLESATVFDNALMGCTNTNKIYMLPVRSDRMGVNVSGALVDLVADSTAEADQWALGTSFGMITDAKIGPDGYMYACNWANGRIYKIKPKADAVFPFDVQRIRGLTTGGNLQGSLEYPDDDRLQLRPGIVFTTGQAPILLECFGTSPFPAPAGLDFVIEASATSPAIDMVIELYNFSTNAYVTAQTIDLTTSDTKYTVTVPGTPSNFVQSGTNEMRARLSLKANGPVFAYPWTGRIDMLHWTSDIP
jgi:glucose/arabinose dehydrogenase